MRGTGRKQKLAQPKGREYFRAARLCDRGCDSVSPMYREAMCMTNGDRIGADHLREAERQGSEQPDLEVTLCRALARLSRDVHGPPLSSRLSSGSSRRRRAATVNCRLVYDRTP